VLRRPLEPKLQYMPASSRSTDASPRERQRIPEDSGAGGIEVVVEGDRGPERTATQSSCRRGSCAPGTGCTIADIGVQPVRERDRESDPMQCVLRLDAAHCSCTHLWFAKRRPRAAWR